MLKCFSPTASHPLPRLFKHKMGRPPAVTAILHSTHGNIRLRWQSPLPGISTHNVNRKVKKRGRSRESGMRGRSGGRRFESQSTFASDVAS